MVQRCLIVKYLFDSFYCSSYFFSYYLCNSFPLNTKKIEKARVELTPPENLIHLALIPSPYIISDFPNCLYICVLCMVFQVNSFQYKLNWLLSWRGMNGCVCDCDLSWCIIKLIIGFWIWNYEALCCHSFAVSNSISLLLLHTFLCDFNPISVAKFWLGKTSTFIKFNWLKSLHLVNHLAHLINFVFPTKGEEKNVSN